MSTRFIMKALSVLLLLFLCLSGFASMPGIDPELRSAMERYSDNDPIEIVVLMKAQYKILEETSVRLTPTKSNITGVGRVDALAAVNAVPAWDFVAESQESQVLVFPNPSKDGFNIQCEGLTSIGIWSGLFQNKD